MSEHDEYAELPTRELPLSTVENTPPLMLDLPDGQQLVVGKLPDGIVIEIATWRGTGRPDSRTNRMMLGVTYDEDDVEETPKLSILKKLKNDNKVSVTAPAGANPTPESSEASIEPTTPTVESTIDATPVAEVTDVQSANEPELLEEVSIPVEQINNVETQDEVVSATEISLPETPLEIIEIIEEEVPVFQVQEPVPAARNMQDLMGARPRTQIQEQNKPSLLDRGHEIVRKSSAPKKKITFNAKVLIKPAASMVAAVLAILFLIGPAGVSFTLPVGGLRTSMSTAENALVIVKKASNYQIGDTVVARVEADGKPEFFATIAATSETEFVLTENNLYHSALRNDVRGKVVLVMPGIGFLLKKIGL
jgi:hypothetical protein